MEEKNGYGKIALFGLKNKLSGFASAVHNVTTDDMADKETRAFWKGARYAVDACVRACEDAWGWMMISEMCDDGEEEEEEVNSND